MTQIKEVHPLIRHLHRIENLILTILFGALMLLAFIQIAGRLFFRVSLQGGDQIIYHLVLWTALAGAAIATREKEHISIDIVNRFLSEKHQRKIHIVTNLFSSFICAILAWQAVRFILSEMEFGNKILKVIPLWTLQTIMPIAFSIIAVRFLIHAILDVMSIFRQKASS